MLQLTKHLCKNNFLLTYYFFLKSHIVAVILIEPITIVYAYMKVVFKIQMSQKPRLKSTLTKYTYLF